MDYDNAEIHSSQRRVLRQSTLPNTLHNTEVIDYYHDNKILTAPTSPKCKLSPQYLYSSDSVIASCDIQPTEFSPQLPVPILSQQHPQQQQQKYGMRRQSTLPIPNRSIEYQQQQQQPPNQIYLSTSPNQQQQQQLYIRSPIDRSESETRCPTFVRQSTFPSNTNVGYSRRPKMLPTSPSRYNQSFDETGENLVKSRVTRQATLPNPDQHVKLLPTSPPKRQTSPQYLKRSPEFIRQNTMPNPDCSSNSLTVCQPTKFLPISPKQKQNFLFPTPQYNPRQFLSQQNVPTVTDSEHYSSNFSIDSRDQMKMIKTRSHSNEEYSITRPYPYEGRRLLPEIPLNRPSRSFGKLVRQDNVKEDNLSGSIQLHDNQRVSGRRIFTETKQNYSTDYSDTSQACSDYYLNDSFLESEETLYCKNNELKISYDKIEENLTDENVTQFQNNPNANDYYVQDESFSVPRESCYHHVSPQKLQQHQQQPQQQQQQQQAPQSQQQPLHATNETSNVTEIISMLPPSGAKSRSPKEFKRKTDATRSVSEDSGIKPTVAKPSTTKRSFSHPEKHSQDIKIYHDVKKLPSPKMAAEIIEKTRKRNLPTLEKRNNEIINQFNSNLHESLKMQEKSQIPQLNQNVKIDESNKVRNSPELNQEETAFGEDNLKTNADEITDEINKSPQIDDDVFHARDDNKNQDNNKDQDNNKNEDNLTSQRQTTLGEAEIRNAVEAAAVIFKKVVLQKRKEKKAAEEEEANAGITSSNIFNSPSNENQNAAASENCTTSPLGSHASTSSDPWPSQSEEDIDRLVALHQNRNSLSSLGVRSDSMVSVYSGVGEGRYGTITVKGQVEFGMQYNYKQSALEIHVVRCKDLAAVDAKRSRSDPYVKVYLLPDKSKSGKRKTKVKKHTLNPIFDEILKFHLPLSSLESRTLWLTVWHSDMFGRNDFLGEVTINLQGKVFDNPQSQWYTLQERSEPYEDLSAYRGDIIVGLKFIPPDNSKQKHSISSGSNSNLRKFSGIKSVTLSSSSSSTSTSTSISTSSSSKNGQLHVLVKEAKNLSPVKANGTCDAFCKSYLLPDKTRSSKQKTHVAKRSTNPVWNHTFIYEDVSLQELSERALELTVWDHDRLASNEFLGGVRFSLGTGKHYGKNVDWMDANGKELSLWQNMLNRPNFWVEGALVLRSSLDTVKTPP